MENFFATFNPFLTTFHFHLTGESLKKPLLSDSISDNLNFDDILDVTHTSNLSGTMPRVCSFSFHYINGNYIDYYYNLQEIHPDNCLQHNCNAHHNNAITFANSIETDVWTKNQEPIKKNLNETFNNLIMICL